MLAGDRARESDRKWKQEKEKAGTQGVGLVVEGRLGSHSVAWERRQPAKPAAA
jgi:hypothetical protein